ncbi:MAG: ECF transporter S component [Acholeplasmatales bacterium]|jgi:ECF transporter S component (folate family)|nr:ECF transporter S component [Acholeplasmatales bacterium]
MYRISDKYSLLKQLLITSIFSAIAIILNYIFSTLIKSDIFGIPFYAIPIIIVSLFFGPFFGVGSAFVVDLLSTLLSGYSYLPLFALGTIMWGLVPGVFSRYIKDTVTLSIAIVSSHVLVTLFNTLSIYIYFTLESALTTLFLRILMIPINSLVIIIIIKVIIGRILIYESKNNS